MTLPSRESPPFTLALAANGRVVIPAAIRSEMGLKTGGRLIARLLDGVLILEPLSDAIDRVQAHVKAKIGPQLMTGERLSEALIQQRRQDAVREDS